MGYRHYESEFIGLRAYNSALMSESFPRTDEFLAEENCAQSTADL